MEEVGDKFVAGEVHVELEVKADSLEVGLKSCGQSSYEHEK